MCIYCSTNEAGRLSLPLCIVAEQLQSTKFEVATVGGKKEFQPIDPLDETTERYLKFSAVRERHDSKKTFYD